MGHYKPLMIYGSTLFFNAIVSFATFSLLTHFLNEVDYGIINLFNSSVILLSPFIAVGIQYTLGVAYFRLDDFDYRQLFTGAISLSVFLTLFFTLLVFLFHETLADFIGVTPVFVLVIPFICLVTVFFDVMLVYFRNRDEYWRFSIFCVVKNIFEVALTILFVVVIGSGWKGRLESLFFTMLILTLIIIWLVKKGNLYSGVFDFPKVKKVFWIGLPFVPERLGIFVLGYSDRFFINYFQGVGDVGFYSAGAQLAVIVNLTILTLSNAFHPQILKKLAQSNVDYQGLKRTTFLFIGLAALITLVVIFSIPIFFKLFIGTGFQKGQIYTSYLVLSMFFWAVYNGFLPYLLSINKNKIIMYITIAGMLMSVVSNFFLVKHFGAVGATYTNLIVCFFMALTMILFVNRYYRLTTIFKKVSIKE